MKFNTQGITFRLSFWYWLTFFISTIFILGAFFYVAKDTLLTQTDREITQHGHRIAEVIYQETTSKHQAFPKEKLQAEFADIPGMLVVIADQNGQILTTSQPIDQDTNILADVLEKSVNLVKPTFIERKLGITRMRLGIFPESIDGNNYNLILVGHPIEVIQSSLTNLLKKLVVLLVFISLAALFISHLLAKRTLRPVRQLAGQMKQISLNNLGGLLPPRKTGDELEELSLAFDALLSRLTQSLERERQFIADVAHELKNPLATLKNLVEVTLSKKRRQDEYQITLKNSLIDINQLSTTINDVLDLAWSESDQVKNHTTILNLSEMVAQIKELAEKLGMNKKIAIVSEISPRIKVRGSRNKLFRALLNLAENAIKYTPIKGRVAITLAKTNSKIILEISNTGPGIQAQDLPYIFDRFFSGRKGSKNYGSGLGLAIVKSIIEAHRGSISVNSLPNKLTTFTVILPKTSS